MIEFFIRTLFTEEKKFTEYNSKEETCLELVKLYCDKKSLNSEVDKKNIYNCVYFLSKKKGYSHNISSRVAKNSVNTNNQGLYTYLVATGVI